MHVMAHMTIRVMRHVMRVMRVMHVMYGMHVGMKCAQHMFS